ncbi:MAG: nucleotidyltransferase domain-containing protein [Pseudomonadota bacterium]
MEKQTISNIAAILKKDKNITLAYVFGSAAKKPMPRYKDIDVAVLLNKELRGLKKLEFIDHISTSLKKKAGCPVDVVILNSAPPALRQQVLKYGILLFERAKGLSNKMMVDTITAYLDYLDILNFFHSKTIKKRS